MTTSVATVGRQAPAATASRVTQVWLLLQWQFRRNAQFLPLLIVVQMLLAVATVVGYSLLAGDVDPVAGLYLATGAPTITLVMVGLVLTPQAVMQSKTEGSHDWMRTLPVPRELFLLADLTMWTLIALPGAILGIVVGAWAFHADIAVSWTLLPAIILVSLTAASLGYAIGTVLAPALAHLISQVLLFVVMLFTPISYPASRLPDWARAVHEWLPLEPMAQTMRAGLASHQFNAEPRAWIVLVVWCALSLTAAVLSLRRRG